MITECIAYGAEKKYVPFFYEFALEGKEKRLRKMKYTFSVPAIKNPVINIELSIDTY